MLLLTFGLTVFVDLTVAVQVGIVVASLLFMKRMSDLTHVQGITAADPDDDEAAEIRRDIPPGVEVYEVNGPFFFGAADKIKDVLTEIARPPKVFILRMRNVPAIDATGIHALEQMAKKCRHQGTMLILTEIGHQPLRAIVRAGKLEVFGGRKHLAKTFEIALDGAREILGQTTSAPPGRSTSPTAH